MLFGRRKPGYTTTVDGSADPEQAVLELQKAELAAKKKPKAEVFDIDAASETARRLRISLVTLNDWVNRGRIRAHKIGGRVLFRDSDVEAALHRIVPIKNR